MQMNQQAFLQTLMTLKQAPQAAYTRAHQTSGEHHHQCCRFSRNTAEVTPKNINFYYQKKYFLGQSIQK